MWLLVPRGWDLFHGFLHLIAEEVPCTAVAVALPASRVRE